MKTMSMNIKAENEKTRHNLHRSHSEEQATTILDNRPSILLQNKQAETMQHSCKYAEIFQRQPEEEEELLQGKFKPTQLQGLEEEELPQGGRFESVQLQEEEELQCKFEPAPRSENRTELPDKLKSSIENLSGVDMSDVRVHSNSAKTSELNALAYAQGADIHLGAGQEHHLAHEAWHVVQQKQGRVEPTVQINGQPINDDAALEHEADIMGAKASRYN